MATHSSILAWRIPMDRGAWQAAVSGVAKSWTRRAHKSLKHTKLFVTPWTVARQAPLSMGILQARILEWVAMPFSMGSSQSRGGTQVL